MHPRNRHTGRYDFEPLTKLCPALSSFATPSPRGDLTIDFADPSAVRTLNGALLQQYYGITKWELPPGYLCPPIPGRADYVHHVADLLASTNGGEVPRGAQVRVLDIGVGASCIYPIIGHGEYGWSFVGTEIDPAALKSAQRIVQANESLRGVVELRPQPTPDRILDGVLGPNEKFDLIVCNPPFHASLEAAQAGSRRKWQNLGRAPENDRKQAPSLNFGGQEMELWCPGGEAGFIRRLIEETARHAGQLGWCSSLVSKEDSLLRIYSALEAAGATECRTVEMGQGQKKSRLVAWSWKKA